MFVLPGLLRYNILFSTLAALITFLPLAFWGEGHLPLWSVLIAPAIIVVDMLNPTLVWVDEATIHVCRVLLPLPLVRHRRVPRAKVDSIELSYAFVQKASRANADIPLKFKYIKICILSDHPLYVIRFAWCAPLLRRIARGLARQIDRPCRIAI